MTVHAPVFAQDAEPELVSRSTKPGFAGKWDGSYTCNGSSASLVLYISESAENSFEAEARFGPTPANPRFLKGSYRLAGQRQGDTLDLSPVAWIHQPDGYEMVGFGVKLAADAGSISSRPLHPACSDIRAWRKGPPPLPAELKAFAVKVGASGFVGAYTGEVVCGGERIRASIRVTATEEGGWRGSLDYVRTDGKRELADVGRPNHLTGVAVSESEVVFEPDYNAFDKVLHKQGSGFRPGMVFRKGAEGWAGEDLNPDCPGIIVRPKTAVASAVAADGEALLTSAWLGKSPFESIGGKNLFQFSDLPLDLLNSTERSSQIK